MLNNNTEDQAAQTAFAKFNKDKEELCKAQIYLNNCDRKKAHDLDLSDKIYNSALNHGIYILRPCSDPGPLNSNFVVTIRSGKGGIIKEDRKFFVSISDPGGFSIQAQSIARNGETTNHEKFNSFQEVLDYFKSKNYTSHQDCIETNTYQKPKNSASSLLGFLNSTNVYNKLDATDGEVPAQKPSQATLLLNSSEKSSRKINFGSLDSEGLRASEGTSATDDSRKRSHEEGNYNASKKQIVSSPEPILNNNTEDETTRTAKVFRASTLTQKTKNCSSLFSFLQANNENNNQDKKMKRCAFYLCKFLNVIFFEKFKELNNLTEIQTIDFQFSPEKQLFNFWKVTEYGCTNDISMIKVHFCSPHSHPYLSNFQSEGKFIDVASEASKIGAIFSDFNTNLIKNRFKESECNTFKMLLNVNQEKLENRYYFSISKKETMQFFVQVFTRILNEEIAPKIASALFANEDKRISSFIGTFFDIQVALAVSQVNKLCYSALEV